MRCVIIIFFTLFFLWIFIASKKIIRKKTSIIIGIILIFSLIGYMNLVNLLSKDKKHKRISERWNFYIYDNKKKPISNFTLIDLSVPQEPKIVERKDYKNQINLFNFVEKKVVIYSEGYIPDTIFIKVTDLNREIHLIPIDEKKP